MWATPMLGISSRNVHTALFRAFSSHISSSAELIAKWHGILEVPQQDASSAPSRPLPTEQLKQLCRDAIHGGYCLSPQQHRDDDPPHHLGLVRQLAVSACSVPAFGSCLTAPASALVFPSVYSTEGAATVVPDRVTGIFMAAYQQLQAPQHKLNFFKLLVAEFGVQRERQGEPASVK